MNYLIQTPTQLSAHLSSLRKSRGLTQAQLGALVGLDQTRIAKIERDPKAVSFGQLLRILTALGVQVALQSRDAPSGRRAIKQQADW